MKTSKDFIQSTKECGIWERADRSLMLGDLLLIKGESYMKLKRDNVSFADLQHLIQKYSSEGLRPAVSGETLGTLVPCDVVSSSNCEALAQAVAVFVKERIWSIDNPKDKGAKKDPVRKRIIPGDLFEGEIWDEVYKDQNETNGS